MIVFFFFQKVLYKISARFIFLLEKSIAHSKAM